MIKIIQRFCLMILTICSNRLFSFSNNRGRLSEQFELHEGRRKVNFLVLNFLLENKKWANCEKKKENFLSIGI